MIQVIMLTKEEAHSMTASHWAHLEREGWELDINDNIAIFIKEAEEYGEHDQIF